MAKVQYKQGTKATYLGLLERNPSALYFCTDTRELFKGNDLYSDGLRIIGNYNELPAFAVAADGILYFCEDNGCGYVLNAARNAWTPVVYGVDNESIAINESGLMYVKSIPIASVTNLTERLESIEQRIVDSIPVVGSDEVSVSDDGVISIVAIPQEKVEGLEERLISIEKAVVGGVRYCGAVDFFELLPIDAAIGDLYEVYEDNSEWCWNGEDWFEYGKTGDFSDFATKDELRTISRLVDYEISHKPVGTLVNYTDDEIRVMCPAGTEWHLQDSGENSDPNCYYIGFKAYAPSDDVMSFKEDLAEIISDSTMYYFEDNDFAGVDEYGRKYSIVWLPVASYRASDNTWTYYGDQSTEQKYIGWHYTVEWYNGDGVKVATDTIRINLSNENCHNSVTPFYVAEIQSALDSIGDSLSWYDI